jgi:hypothetical protein
MHIIIIIRRKIEDGIGKETDRMNGGGGGGVPIASSLAS